MLPKSIKKQIDPRVEIRKLSFLFKKKDISDNKNLFSFYFTYKIRIKFNTFTMVVSSFQTTKRCHCYTNKKTEDQINQSIISSRIRWRHDYFIEMCNMHFKSRFTLINQTSFSVENNFVFGVPFEVNYVDGKFVLNQSHI